jgi:hypothetical protein
MPFAPFELRRAGDAIDPPSPNVSKQRAFPCALQSRRRTISDTVRVDLVHNSTASTCCSAPARAGSASPYVEAQWLEGPSQRTPSGESHNAAGRTPSISSDDLTVAAPAQPGSRRRARPTRRPRRWLGQPSTPPWWVCHSLPSTSPAEMFAPRHPRRARTPSPARGLPRARYRSCGAPQGLSPASELHKRPPVRRVAA